jgi:hypothetical protein
MPPLSRKAQIAAICCACFAMLSVGASRSAPVEYRTKVVYKDRIVKQVRYKTKIVTKTVANRPPSGFMTGDECRAVPFGMKFQEMIFRFGWPAFDEGDTYSGFFDYPLVSNHDKTCSIDLVDQKVVSAVVR